MAWMERSRGSRPDQVRVSLGPPIAEELPEVAHLAHHLHVHVAGDELVLVLAGLGDDLAARIHEIARAIELADVPGRLGADAVAGADIDAVGDRGGGLLEIPEILREASYRRRGIDDVFGAVQRERAPALGEV